MTDFRDRLGAIPSPPDPRDHPLSMYIPETAEVALVLPRWRYPGWSRSFPVYDQIGPSCVGNSSALSATIDQRRDHRHWDVYDGEELYALCKQQDGIPTVAGTYPRVAFKIRQERGAKVKKSGESSEVGQYDQIGAYAALHSIEEIKVAIYLYGSSLLGSTWYEEWFDVPTDKILPPGINPAGGHAYTAIGWSTARSSLLIQNSWGTEWGYSINGTGGRAWLPYDRVDFNDFEAWRAIDMDD